MVGIRSFLLEINEISPRGHEEANNRLDKKKKKKKKKHTHIHAHTELRRFQRSTQKDRFRAIGLFRKKKKKRKKGGKLAAFAW